MSALFAPSATFVNISVFADEEVVTNVGPSFVVHVFILEKKKIDNRYDMQVPLNLLFVKMQNKKEEINLFYLIYRDLF